MKLSLNGLLIPLFSRLGRRITVEGKNRGKIGMVWGASEITFLNAAQDKYYTVRHSKRAAWRQTLRLLRNARQFLRAYDGLAQAYRKAYPDYTSETYWQAKLGLQGPAKSQKEAAE
jgi:galactofuranosylgalactofuranosylrhamnosyl-N-acetylglucosaminyl-diphospho-decaprenol beta-1,5/1,6-galactofuranosyltransferase